MNRNMMFLASLLLLVLSTSMPFFAGCGRAAAPEQRQITVVGSTALMPLAEAAASQFMAKNPGVKVLVQGGGSGTGLTQVASGAADIGMSDIFAQEKEGIDHTKLVDHRVCVVGFAAVVNPDAGVTGLTKKQLIDVFTGRVTNWKQLGGADKNIVVINRPKGSGTRATFTRYALDGAEPIESLTQESSGAVRKMVAETPGAISYLALSYVDSSVKALSIDGVEPTKENIVTGKYPVWSYEHMYTLGSPKGAVKEFLDYMLSDEVQKGPVVKMGFIPIVDMKVVRNP